jgi:hypothetical protein
MAWASCTTSSTARRGDSARHFALSALTNGSGAKPAAALFKEATGEDLNALIPGWRDAVLALKMPAQVSWAVLSVTKAASGEDLRSRDRLWSFDGIECYSARAFTELWIHRAKDRPIEVVVVRDSPRRGRRHRPVRARDLQPKRDQLRAFGDSGGWRACRLSASRDAARGILPRREDVGGARAGRPCSPRGSLRAARRSRRYELPKRSSCRSRGAGA